MQRLVVLAIALVFAASCSIALRTVEDNEDPAVPPRCDVSFEKPGLDTAAVVLFGLVSLALIYDASQGCNNDGDDCGSAASDEATLKRGVGLVLLAPATIYAVGAAYGYWQVSRCRALVRSRTR